MPDSGSGYPIRSVIRAAAGLKKAAHPILILQCGWYS
jgi:hypothetical protein